MRSDFYSKVAAYKGLAETITVHQMLVSPMTEKELREAILLPAETVGLELEKALVETLLKDTIEAPGVLPLLQHSLLELFERRNGNLLTLAAYQEIGGVKGALAHRADATLDTLTEEERQLTRRIFLRLVQPGEGLADTRRRAAFSEVLSRKGETGMLEMVVQTLTNANLLVTSHDPDTQEVVLDVSHEALIREWPRLREWLDEDQQGLRIRTHLSQAAQEWDARGRDEDTVYRGARLLEAEEWAAAHPDDINPLEKTFLEACIAIRQRQQSRTRDPTTARARSGATHLRRRATAGRGGRGSGPGAGDGGGEFTSPGRLTGRGGSGGGDSGRSGRYRQLSGGTEC